MTTLYRTVLIETAEQAEALPIGTVAHSYGPDGSLEEVSHKQPDGLWSGSGDAGQPYGNGLMVGDTALVPIEAKEEATSEMATSRGREHFAPSHGVFKTPSRRLVTPWALAEEPAALADCGDQE